MDFIFDAPFPFSNQPSPTTPSLQQQNAPASSDSTSHLRAEWEAKFAHMEMPPPPPGLYVTREEMISAAKTFSEQHGYTLVIGHSSKNHGEPSRCWLACDLGGVYRNRHHLTPDVRKRKRESRKTDCPMRILGTKRKLEDGWMLHLVDDDKASHNHGPNRRFESLTLSEWPELEENLYQWHHQCELDGKAIHGNTLKAKAVELWKTMPQYRNNRPQPDFGNGWLNDYRQRHGLPVRTNNPRSIMKNSMISGSTVLSDIESHLPIPPINMELFKSVKAYVKEYMSLYDASHDFNHILRVLALSNRILKAERQTHPTVEYDTMAVYLAALLHDVGDKKYAEPGKDTENQIAEVLLERGASDVLALKVQMIAKHVSYSTEVKNPRLVRAVLTQHPELGIVQDSDRLDAIGAVGIGRTFTFGGAKRPLEGMHGVIQHFDEKLLHLEGIMKTEAGRCLARERTQRLELFKSWWEEENDLLAEDA